MSSIVPSSGGGPDRSSIGNPSRSSNVLSCQPMNRNHSEVSSMPRWWQPSLPSSLGEYPTSGHRPPSGTLVLEFECERFETGGCGR